MSEDILRTEHVSKSFGRVTSSYGMFPWLWQKNHSAH